MLRQFVVEPKSFNKLNAIEKKGRFKSKKIRIVQVTCVGWEGDRTLAYSLDQLQATTESTLSRLEELGIKPTDISFDYFFHFANEGLKKELDDVIASGKYSFLNDPRIRKFTHEENGRRVEKNYAETGKYGNYQQTEAYKLAKQELQQIIGHENSKDVMEEARQADKHRFKDRQSSKKNKYTDSSVSKKDYGFNFTDAQLMDYHDSTTAELLSFVPKVAESDKGLVIFLYPHDYLVQWYKIVGNANQAGFATIVERDPEAFIPLQVKFSKSPANQLSAINQAASASSTMTAASTAATTTVATNSTSFTMNALATARSESAPQMQSLPGEVLPASLTPRSTSSRGSFGEQTSGMNPSRNLSFEVAKTVVQSKTVGNLPSAVAFTQHAAIAVAITQHAATLARNSPPKTNGISQFNLRTSPARSIETSVADSSESSSVASVTSMSTTSSHSSDGTYDNAFALTTRPTSTPTSTPTPASSPTGISESAECRGQNKSAPITVTHRNRASTNWPALFETTGSGDELQTQQQREQQDPTSVNAHSISRASRTERADTFTYGIGTGPR